MAAQVLELFPNLSPSMPDPPATKLKKNPPKKQKYTEEFEAFWQAYPRKLNCSKSEAFRSWTTKLDDDDRAMVMRVLPTFVQSMRGKEEQFIPHPVTWLNQRRFETVRVPPSVPSAPAPEVDWDRVLRIYAATGRWNSEFGPEPGKAGYKGPAVR